MKSYFIAMMTAIMIAGTATAQNVNFGIKGGLNLSNISQDGNSGFDQKAGYHFGILTHIHFTDRFALQPEIVYSVQGAKYTIGNVDTHINLDYVNVPVMFQYMFDNGFRLQAGPQVSFLNKAKSRTNDVNTDFKNNFETIDFGIGMGVGYVHPPSGFGIDARYNMGLGNINKNGADAYNRVIQLGVFYLFQHD
jgi:hypothetical protein